MKKNHPLRKFFKTLKYLIVILLIIIGSLFILLLYIHITYVANHNMIIINNSNEIINIKSVRIDDIHLSYPRVSLKPAQTEAWAAYDRQISYFVQFKSNHPEEVEVMINDPTVGDKDFKIICKLESKKSESCFWTVRYQNINGPTLTCFYDSIDELISK